MIVAPADLLPPVDVVYFAGLGGSSEAYREALGKDPDVAINHWDVALAVHQVNHPGTECHVSDVFEADCRTILPGRRWRSAWFSPDCRHFSPAKGAVPVDAGIRGLAWVAIPVAVWRKPDVIFLENVPEFLNWGPLIKGADGRMRPDPARKGETFRRWKRRLEQCGYVVDWQVQSAADYGAPTIRRRLFLVARRDGKPIRWTAPTHAPAPEARKRGLRPYVPAADVIDFSQPVHSIFLTAAEAREMGLRIKRPLEEATLRRIARGVRRFVIEAADPFIVPITHKGDDRCHSLREPLRTITGANRGEFSLISAVLAPRYGERAGQDPRAHSVREPLPTIVTSANGSRLATVQLDRCAAFLEQANGGMTGHDARDPVSTILGRGTTQRLVTAHLSHFYGQGVGGDPRDALTTVTSSGAHHGLASVELAKPFAPHGEELRAFLVKYYGAATSADLADPLHTATSRARFGLVYVAGAVWQIADIGMRMLTPDELKAAQGFPRGYVTARNIRGQAVTKTDQNYLIGNSVSPIHGAEIIRANLAGDDETARAAA